MDKIDYKPLVAIHCLVYNHETYLRDCFEGFVMQQTNFPFVAIVHDDASTDGSAAIIREYEEKYPHIFKPIYEIENQYSKRDGSLERIMNEAIEATSVKYVAMCEGDDYWTDPLKLQKQVDFLEANIEYSICFHNVNTLIQKTGEVKDEFLVRDMPERSTIWDLAEGNYIHTPSVLYRREKLDFNKLKKMLPCLPLDYVMWMLLAEKGDIYKFKEPMAVYRLGSGIWESSSSIKRYILTITTLSKLSFIFSDKEKVLILNNIAKLQEELMEIIQQKDQQLYMIQHSLSFRISKCVLKPIKVVRDLILKR